MPGVGALDSLVVLADEVRQAVAAGDPVVALESTLIAHGLPFPDNLATAEALESAVRAAGAVPATIAVLAGKLRVGLDRAGLERLARGPVVKAGAADLGPLLSAGSDGATTVSATAFAAARAGIAVFATGGIGGVHRGDGFDISSDLTTLATEPVAVVSAGAKAILDLPRTLEVLETLGVPVIGHGTDELPAFYTRKSGLRLSHRVDSPTQAAQLIDVHFALHPRRGLLLCNPIPEEEALDPGQVEQAISAALAEAAEQRVTGKALTPFLLAAIAKATALESVRANRALVLSNARFAAEVATALSRLRKTRRAA